MVVAEAQGSPRLGEERPEGPHLLRETSKPGTWPLRFPVPRTIAHPRPRGVAGPGGPNLMDGSENHLPLVNVLNITAGYDAQQAGTLCRKK